MGSYREDTTAQPKRITFSRCDVLEDSTFLGIHWESTKYMGVSKNKGTPKWMIYNGNPHTNGWFGGTPIFGNPHMVDTKHTNALGCWRWRFWTFFPHEKAGSLYRLSQMSFPFGMWPMFRGEVLAFRECMRWGMLKLVVQITTHKKSIVVDIHVPMLGPNSIMGESDPFINPPHG